MKRIYLILLFPLLVQALAWWAIKFVWCVIVKPSEAWRLAVSVDQLANAAFNGMVRFYDYNNAVHSLSIVDATAVILAVSQAFQTVMANKQTKMVAIETATTLPATPTDADYDVAIAAVNGVTW